MTPGNQAGLRTGSSLGRPHIPAPAVATAGTRAWGPGSTEPLPTTQPRPTPPAPAVAIQGWDGRTSSEAARLSVEKSEEMSDLSPSREREIKDPQGLNSSDRPQPLIGHSQSRWSGRGTHTHSPSSPNLGAVSDHLVQLPVYIYLQTATHAQKEKFLIPSPFFYRSRSPTAPGKQKPESYRQC